MPGEYQLEQLPLTLSAACLGFFDKPSGWFLSVNSAGEAELTLMDDTKRRFSLRPEDWRAFRDAVRDQRFFEMADDYGNDRVIDGSTRTLTVSLGHMTKTVRVHHLDSTKDVAAKPAVRMLMLVRGWFADADAVDFTPYDKRFLGVPRSTTAPSGPTASPTRTEAAAIAKRVGRRRGDSAGVRVVRGFPP